MPWRHISGNGLKGWRCIKHHEFYDAYCFEEKPDEEVEVYLIDYIPPNDMAGYDFRLRNSHPFIPQILDVITPQTTKQVFTKVIMQHTSMRLDECRSLPNKPLEIIVAQIFLGFEAIFKQYGPFRVKENMIGFDKKGTAKVWLNFNFAKNHMNPFDVLRANRESVMVKNLFDIFQPFGYRIERQVTTFQDAKKLVMSNLMNKGTEKALMNIGWRQRADLRPKSPLTMQKKQSQQLPNQSSSKSYKSRYSGEVKTFNNPISYSSKLSASSQRKKQQKILPPTRTSLQRTQAKDQDIPTFIDQVSVQDYLGSSLNMVDNKLMFISFLRQNTITDAVNDLANIFEYALQKDPDLYSILLQIKGQINRNPSIAFQSKIKSIKDMYNGISSVETSDKPQYETPKSPQVAQYQNAQIVQTNEQSPTNQFFGYKQNQSPKTRKWSSTSKQEDLIQSFDKALEKFVLQKQKVRSSKQLGFVKKSSPVYVEEPKFPPISIDKRTTGSSDRWEIDANKEKSIQQKMRIKQKNFAGLKQQAARVLGLSGI